MSNSIIPPIAPSDEKKDDSELPAMGRYRQLAVKWRASMAVLTAAATFLAINQIFALGFFLDITMLVDDTCT
jgi:hypothetical protein